MPGSADPEKQLILKLSELTSKIEIILEKHEELAENIIKIKEAVYNPDQGLYARLKELDIRLSSLEQWKSMSTKFMWLIFTSIAGIIVTIFTRALGF